MAEVTVKTNLEGDELKVHVLTRVDVHPLFYKEARIENIRLSDFMTSSISPEEKNQADVILYKDGKNIKVLKSRFEE